MVLLVGLIVLLAFTLFSLKKVTIDFRTSTTNITATNEEIIQVAEFDMGSSVLIHGKKDYKKKIENFDPYIKVINIETVFPSTFVVHLSERQEVYAVPFKYGHYICDEELRVLRISYTFSNSQENAILLTQEGIEVKNNIKEGEYIKNIKLSSVYSTLYGLNRPLGEQKALIESITISTEYDKIIKRNQKITTIKYYSGQTFKIINDSYGLKYKLKLMNDVYAQLYTYIGKTIKDGEQQIVLTQENLKDCTIIINNYYDYTSYTERDCYFDIKVKNI